MAAKSSIIRFSPDDRETNLGIQTLSYFERGIWFEIMLKMHASPEVGKLMLTPGKAVPDSIIASKILKIDPGEWDKVKAVLLEYGVASICPATGALMCSRMVQDARSRVKSRAHGKRGGHPSHTASFLPPPLTPTLPPPYPYPTQNFYPPLRVKTERKENPSPPSHSPLFKRKEKKRPPHTPPFRSTGKFSQTEKNRLRVSENSPLMFKIGELFRRNKSTLWTIGESEALSQIDPSTKEVALLKGYYSAHFPKDKDYRRRNMQTLLNNWTSELDRARAWAKEEQKRLSKRLRNATGIIPPIWKLKSKDLKPCQDSMALIERGNPTPSINLRDCANERSVWPCNSKHMKHDIVRHERHEDRGVDRMAFGTGGMDHGSDGGVDGNQIG